MSTSPRFFPPAITEALPHDEGVLLAKDRSGETLLLRIDDFRTRHHESWLKIRPFDDDFGLDMEGGAAVPVHLYHVQKDVRGALAKLLRIGEKPELSIPFYVDTAPDKTMVFQAAPQYGESALLTLESVDPENVHQDIVSSRNIGGMQVSVLQPHVPMKQYRHERLAFGRTRKFVTKNIDHGDDPTASALLTPERRGVLDGIGKIVYESDPRGTDRLLICLKRHTEPAGISRLCELFEPMFASHVRRHTNGLSCGIEKIETMESHQCSLLCDEKEPAQSHADVPGFQEQRSLHMAMRERNDIRNAERRAGLMQKISTMLRPGGSVLVVDDGHLFESGTSAREPNRDSFESYVRFLPKTQCIVLEDSAYALLQFFQAHMHDVLLSEKNSNELLNMQYVLSEHMNARSRLLHESQHVSRREMLTKLRRSELEIQKIESTFISLFARRSRRETSFAS